MCINLIVLNIKLNCNTYICIYSTRYRASCRPPPPPWSPWQLRVLEGFQQSWAVQWGGRGVPSPEPEGLRAGEQPREHGGPHLEP